jgi:hypothetical protein
MLMLLSISAGGLSASVSRNPSKGDVVSLSDCRNRFVFVAAEKRSGMATRNE